MPTWKGRIWPKPTCRMQLLDGADLREAVNLTQEQVDQAMGDASTMLPEGLHPPPHWAGSS